MSLDDDHSWRKQGQHRLDPALREDIGMAVHASVFDKGDPATLKRVFDGLGRLSPADLPMVARLLRADFEAEIGRGNEMKRRMNWWDRITAAPPPPATAEDPLLCWLNLLHSNGFAREQALDTLDQPPPTGFWMAVLDERRHDRVPAVRRAAQRAFQRIADRLDPEIRVDAMPFLRQASPDDDPETLPAPIEAALVRRLMTGAQGYINPLFRRMLMQTAALDGHLEALATGARVAPVRARALRTLITGHADEIRGYEHGWVDRDRGHARRFAILATRPVAHEVPLDRLIAIGAADKAATVRKVAVDGLILHRRAIADMPAMLALFEGEKNATVRDRLGFLERHHAG